MTIIALFFNSYYRFEHTNQKECENMAVAAHKGAIAFGLVFIPVQLYRTTRDHDISFNQLCKDTKERVKYKKYCPSCKGEVKAEDIVKGYQYEKDKYVIMTDSDFEKIKTEKDKTIQILQFAELSDIDPIFFEKNYYALPVAGGEKAFYLFASTLKDSKKVAIAKTVIGTKENLLALCPSEDGLLVKTLFYSDEVVDMPKAIEKVKLQKEEIGMAKMLIDSMTKPFEPTNYQDEYQARLRDAIAQKINGQEIVSVQEESKNVAVDLMEALKKSLEMNNSESKTTSKQKTTKTKRKTKATTKRTRVENELAS